MHQIRIPCSKSSHEGRGLRRRRRPVLRVTALANSLRRKGVFTGPRPSGLQRIPTGTHFWRISTSLTRDPHQAPGLSEIEDDKLRKMRANTDGGKSGVEINNKIKINGKMKDTERHKFRVV